MWDSLTRTLLALTFVTGIVDAVSFIALGHVFAAMQTGNVLFLGLGIGGAPDAAFWAPLVSLLAFLLGGGLGILIARGAAGTRLALGQAIAVEALLLLIAASFLTAAEVSEGNLAAHVAVALLALAMGARSTIARGTGDPSLATTVLNLSFSTMLMPGAGVATGSELSHRAAALLTILAGAVAGALLVKSSPQLAIGTAAALAGLISVHALGAARRPAARS